MYFNTDTTSTNYHSYRLGGYLSGGTVSNTVNEPTPGTIPIGNGRRDANDFGSISAHIPNYASTSFNKIATCLSHYWDNTTGTSGQWWQLRNSVLWTPSATRANAITQLTFQIAGGLTFASGSLIRVFGVN
jgi:hypothetical protein